MTTTYTVYSAANGTEYGRGLSAIDAAQEILGHDGHTYELRREGAAWQLFVSRGSVNAMGGTRGLTEASGRKLIRSYAASEAEAWNEIAAMVIGADWEGPAAMTDSDYDAMLAEATGENE